MDILKICRLTSPFTFKRLKPTFAELKSAIEGVKFFDKKDIASMMSGYTEYVRLAEEIPPLKVDATVSDELEAIVAFWRTNAHQLRKLNLFVRYCFTIQCSSACVERVFSILKNSFDDKQKLALEDYVQLSLMRQYNRFDMALLDDEDDDWPAPFVAPEVAAPSSSPSSPVPSPAPSPAPAPLQEPFRARPCSPL